MSFSKVLNEKIFKIKNSKPINIYVGIYLPIILFVFITMIFLGKNMFASFFKWTSYFRGDLIYSMKFLVNGYSSNDFHAHPPLINLYYTILINTTKILESGMDKTITNRILAFIINWTPVVLSVILLNDFFKKNNNNISIFKVLLVAMPAPLFTSLRSGNYTYIIIPFTLYYIFNYNSENMFKKEIALLSLAIASNLKIIPAVYSLLLIDNKDIKSFLRFAIYSILFFFIPIIFIMPYLNYYDRVMLLFNSMLSYSSGYLRNLTGSFKIIYNILNLLFASLNISFDTKIIVKILSKIVFLILLVYFFNLKDRCDKIYCLTLMQFLIGTITYHSFVLFIIPIVFFVNKDKLDNNDFILFTLMTIMMTLTFLLFFIPPYMFIPDLYLRSELHSAYIDLLLTSQIILFIISKKDIIFNNLKTIKLHSNN